MPGAAWLVSRFSPLSWNPGGSWLCSHLEAQWPEEESAKRPIQVVGRIQLLGVIGLRSLFSFPSVFKFWVLSFMFYGIKSLAFLLHETTIGTGWGTRGGRWGLRRRWERPLPQLLGNDTHFFLHNFWHLPTWMLALSGSRRRGEDHMLIVIIVILEGVEEVPSSSPSSQGVLFSFIFF